MGDGNMERDTKWKIVNRETIQLGRFQFIKDDVILPSEKPFTFSYLNFAEGVCVLPITNDRQVVCIRQYRHAIQDWQWELPAGLIDENLTPLEAAKKELKEETGYTAQNWISLGSFFPSPGSTNERIHLFAALDLEPGRQQLEASEQIHVHLLEWEALMDLVKRGEFQHGPGIATILRYMTQFGQIQES
jgi:ADP-ribose pyrophosphatase